MDDTAGKTGTVSSHVIEVNNVLVRNLVERFSEALVKINMTLEASGIIEEKSLSDLKEILGILQSVKSDAETILSSTTVSDTVVSEILAGLTPFFEDRPYHIEDREKIISFLRRATSTVANWTPEEKSLVIDTMEKSPGALADIKKKLRRLYLLVAGAGVIAILSSVGAPEWIKKLATLLLGS